MLLPGNRRSAAVKHVVRGVRYKQSVATGGIS